MIRDRSVREMNAELIDDHHFRINLTTQAGTYIKEFIHGDLGRTTPSISDIIGKNCDILELDVIVSVNFNLNSNFLLINFILFKAVNLDFPPEINSD